MEEDKDDFYRKYRRSIKKVRALTKVFDIPNTYYIMEFLTIDEKDEFSKMLFWKKKYQQECAEIKSAINEVTYQLKDLTREECCDKMCIEQELLGGCKTCPYHQYCTTPFGETVR